MDIVGSMTPVAIATLLLISERRTRELVDAGVLPLGPPSEVVAAYRAYLCRVAAGDEVPERGAPQC